VTSMFGGFLPHARSLCCCCLRVCDFGRLEGSGTNAKLGQRGPANRCTRLSRNGRTKSARLSRTGWSCWGRRDSITFTEAEFIV